jgi:hypothetical protein
VRKRLIFKLILYYNLNIHFERIRLDRKKLDWKLRVKLLQLKQVVIEGTKNNERERRELATK